MEFTGRTTQISEHTYTNPPQGDTSANMTGILEMAYSIRTDSKHNVNAIANIRKLSRHMRTYEMISTALSSYQHQHLNFQDMLRFWNSSIPGDITRPTTAETSVLGLDLKHDKRDTSDKIHDELRLQHCNYIGVEIS